jgi:hypothetical protein
MTKSRIALSKINRSVSVRSGSRPSDFHEQRLASSPRRTPRGTPEAAALRTSKLIAFRGASKENLQGNADYPHRLSALAPARSRSWLDQIEKSLAPLRLHSCLSPRRCLIRPERVPSSRQRFRQIGHRWEALVGLKAASRRSPAQARADHGG